MNADADVDHREDAAALVRAAATRGLARRHGWRLFASVLWSGFLGATVSLVVVLLMPEGWLDPPVDLGALSAMFALMWALALVPAFLQALLSMMPDGPHERR